MYKKVENLKNWWKNNGIFFISAYILKQKDDTYLKYNTLANTPVEYLNTVSIGIVEL